jgi:addiction module HigA family antidote
MSINALAIALRVPATRIGAIVKGERAVTADTALRLARFFDTSPEFWMNLQAMHDLTKTRIENGEAIARHFCRFAQLSISEAGRNYPCWSLGASLSGVSWFSPVRLAQGRFAAGGSSFPQESAPWVGPQFELLRSRLAVGRQKQD